MTDHFEAGDLERIERGLADVREGRTIDHEIVAEWLRSWSNGDEAPALPASEPQKKVPAKK